MTFATVLSDELLEEVMAAGHADVLVGLPTRNHADTVAPVARAVMGAFSGPLVRQRTVLLNMDGHSTDGTAEVVRSIAAPTGDILTGQYALRTIHRISAPYHGVPDRSTALRTIFTVAELMHVRVVVILDPTAVAIDAEDVARWIRAVWSGGADFVKPVVPRARGDGPLVAQLVRPLLRAACGIQLAEPLDTQLACSGPFVARALAADFWGLDSAEVGVDAFLTVLASTNKVQLGQVATAGAAQVDSARRPRPTEVFQQVVGALLEALARSFAAWADITGSRPVAIDGTLPPPPPRLPAFNLTSFTDAFCTGVDALAPLLSAVLGPATLQELAAAARNRPLRLADELWARTVMAFVAAAIRKFSPPRELAQMLEPLYLGRVASALNELAAGEGADKLESLALRFEEQKPALVAAVRGREEPDHGKPDPDDIAASA